MATTPTIKKAEFLSGSIIQDLDADHLSENDIMSGPCRLIGFYIDNSNNVAEVEYLKLYDNKEPTVDTTVPDWIFEIEGGARGFLPINPGVGAKFLNGLSYACVTEGGTGGVTTPTANVVIVPVCLSGVS